MTSPAIEIFRSTPEKLAALSAALSSPAVQEALQLIQLANVPVDPMTLNAPPTLDADRVVSRKYHLMLGVHDAIATLNRMATPMPVRDDTPIMDDTDFDNE